MGGDESGQTLTFTLAPSSGDFSDLFSEAPAIDSSGNLTYKPAANAFGSMAVDVSLSDGADTANDSFTIEITAVNDAPSFTAGTDRSVTEDSGRQTVAGWATHISAMPAGVAAGLSGTNGDESGQTLTFTLAPSSGDFSDLFSEAPAIDSSGNLTYKPAANAFGSMAVDVSLSDGADTANDSFTIEITAVNDDPIATGVPTDVTVTEDIVSNLDLSSLTVTDINSANDNITVTLATTSGGTLIASDGGSVTVAGSDPGHMTLAGTVS